MFTLARFVLVAALCGTAAHATNLRTVNTPEIPKPDLPSVPSVPGVGGGNIPSVPSVGQLPSVPGSGKRHEHRPKRELMDMIDSFRAEICAELKGEHGERFKSFAACKKFMEEACQPGKDMVMDKDSTEITSRKGYCREYFSAKEAEKELAEEEGEVEEPEHAIVAPGPAPAQIAPAPAPEPEASTDAPAPAPAPEEKEEEKAPAPAPAEEKEEEKKDEKKDEKKEPEDDTAWYYKEGGKWSGRMHMDADLKLPTQGYWGKLVEHEDQVTVTGDWQTEFGPHSHLKTYAEICKKHPDNAWCLKHFPHHSHSSSNRATVQISALLATLFFCIRA